MRECSISWALDLCRGGASCRRCRLLALPKRDLRKPLALSRLRPPAAAAAGDGVSSAAQDLRTKSRGVSTGGGDGESGGGEVGGALHVTWVPAPPVRPPVGMRSGLGAGRAGDSGSCDGGRCGGSGAAAGTAGGEGLDMPTRARAATTSAHSAAREGVKSSVAVGGRRPRDYGASAAGLRRGALARVG